MWQRGHLSRGRTIAPARGGQVEVPAFAVHRLGRLRLMLWQLAAIAPFKMQRNIGVFLGLLPPSRQPPNLTARRPTAEKLTLK